MEFRRITMADADALAALALRSIPQADELAVSGAKVRRMVDFFATQPGHFQMAAFDDGKVLAGLAAVVTEMPFHEGSEATVCFCYSQASGVGSRLLRELIAFVNGNFYVRRLIWPMNPTFDERIVKLARRLGFQSAAPMLIYQKGG